MITLDKKVCKFKFFKNKIFLIIRKNEVKIVKFKVLKTKIFLILNDKIVVFVRIKCNRSSKV